MSGTLKVFPERVCNTLSLNITIGNRGINDIFTIPNLNVENFPITPSVILSKKLYGFFPTILQGLSRLPLNKENTSNGSSIPATMGTSTLQTPNNTGMLIAAQNESGSSFQLAPKSRIEGGDISKLIGKEVKLIRMLVSDVTRAE
jgi:hypothetical protein